MGRLRTYYQGARPAVIARGRGTPASTRFKPCDTPVKERGMSLPSRRKLAATAALVLGVGMLPFIGGTSASAAPKAPTVTTRHIQKGGSASYKPTPNGSGDPAAISSEIPRAFGPEANEDAAATARGHNAAG